MKCIKLLVLSVSYGWRSEIDTKYLMICVPIVFSAMNLVSNGQIDVVITCRHVKRKGSEYNEDGNSIFSTMLSRSGKKLWTWLWRDLSESVIDVSCADDLDATELSILFILRLKTWLEHSKFVDASQSERNSLLKVYISIKVV